MITGTRAKPGVSRWRRPSLGYHGTLLVGFNEVVDNIVTGIFATGRCPQRSQTNVKVWFVEGDFILQGNAWQ